MQQSLSKNGMLTDLYPKPRYSENFRKDMIGFSGFHMTTSIDIRVSPSLSPAKDEIVWHRVHHDHFYYYTVTVVPSRWISLSERANGFFSLSFAVERLYNALEYFFESFKMLGRPLSGNRDDRICRIKKTICWTWWDVNDRINLTPPTIL